MADYSAVFEAAGKQHNVDPALLRAVMYNGEQSNGDPRAVSPKGASGLMQLMPGTAKDMGVTDVNDPAQNIYGGAKYLAQQLDKYGSVPLALAAYNAGPGAVDKAGGIPNFPETQAYIKRTLGAYQGQNMPKTSTASTTTTGDPFLDMANAVQSGKTATPTAAPAASDPFLAMGNAVMSNNAPTPAQAAPQKTSYDPTAGMSTFDKVMAGAGKSVVDMGHGLQQIGAEVGNKISPSLVSDQTVADLRAQEDERKRLDAPLMNTGAGAAGYLGGTLASSLVPASLAAKAAGGIGMARTANALRTFMNPQTYGAAATVGALQGAVQPVGNDDSRISNAGLGAVGGLAGNALVNTIGRVAQPVANNLSPLMQKGADVLRAAGVPLDAAQQTGSVMLNRVKSALSDNPFTAGAQAAKRGEQQASFNNAVLNTIGSTGEAATPDVMSAAKSRIGQVFDDVAARNPVQFDNALNQGISDIQTNARRELNDQQYGVIQRQIDNLMDKANNPNLAIDGNAYQNIKMSLDRISGGQDTSIGHWARQLRGELDDALERSTVANGNPADMDALRTARGQYANMKKIEGAIDTEGNGNISPAKLANIFGQKANRNMSVYGAGDQALPDLARAGKNLLTDKMANSGTTARAAMQLLAPALLGGSYGAYQGDWEKAGLGALGGIAAPKAAQFAINNPTVANYLAQGIGNNAVRGVFMAPRNNALLNALIRRSVTPQLPVLQNGAQQ